MGSCGHCCCDRDHRFSCCNCIFGYQQEELQKVGALVNSVET